jgi:hypothetical protein
LAKVYVYPGSVKVLNKDFKEAKEELERVQNRLNLGKKTVAYKTNAIKDTQNEIQNMELDL